MKKCAMTGEVLDFFADDTKFFPQCASCIINIWQERAKANRKIIGSLVGNEYERDCFRHCQRLAGEMNHTVQHYTRCQADEQVRPSFHRTPLFSFCKPL